MKKRTTMILLTAALWVLLAGCGMKTEPPAPSAPAPEPEIQTPAVPEPSPEPEAPPEDPAPPEPDGVAAQYVGAWRDAEDGASGGQCRMQIACADGVYTIDINWGGGTGENTHWQYTGTYDDIWKGIDYIGTRYEETTQEDGTIAQSIGLEEATGLIYLSEDGTMLWEDTFEHRGDGMKFQKES